MSVNRFMEFKKGVHGICPPTKLLYDQWMNICDIEDVRPTTGQMPSNWDVFGRSEYTILFNTPEGMVYYGKEESVPIDKKYFAINAIDIETYWKNRK